MHPIDAVYQSRRTLLNSHDERSHFYMNGIHQHGVADHVTNVQGQKVETQVN